MPTSSKASRSATGKRAANATAAKKPAAKTPRTGAAGGSADAIALLTRDHRDATKLFKAYDKLVQSEADSSERLELATQICSMLTAHTAIEEEIFYPAVREALEADDLLDEAEVEHASAKELIGQIESMDPDDDLYDAKVTVLGEYVQHHVKEEETEMFPKASKAKKLDLASLGQALAARKAELLDELAEEDA